MIKIYSNKISTLENIKAGLKCDLVNVKKEFLRLPQDVNPEIKVTYKDYIKYLESRLEDILTQISIVKNANKKELDKLV